MPIQAKMKYGKATDTTEFFFACLFMEIFAVGSNQDSTDHTKFVVDCNLMTIWTDHETPNLNVLRVPT